MRFILLAGFLFGTWSLAFGQAIFQPAGISTNMGELAPPGWAIGHTIDQSGLVGGYTSGVTNFASFTAGTSHLPVYGTSNVGWYSALNTTMGIVTFDMGSALNLSGMALWNVEQGKDDISIQGFNLFTDNDSDFGNGTSVSLGGFIATNSPGGLIIPAQTFAFGTTTARYVHMQITSNVGGPLSGFGEVAFAGTIPEPSAYAAIVGGFAFLGVIGFRIVKRRRLPVAS